MEEILSKAKTQLQEVQDLAADDLKGVKTGRAKPNLVEDLKVNAYESTLTLKELASITASDPHTIVISPWDKSVLKNIEKAIMASDLHLTPNIDNDLIRINIAPLTEEGRRDLVKLVYQKLESGRKLIRQVRNEIKQELNNKKGQPGISEDDIRKGIDDLQSMVDEFVAKIEALGKTKEEELMTI